MAEHKTTMAELRAQANQLVRIMKQTLDGLREPWIIVHELDIWTCKECGHGGTGPDLDIGEQGEPECPWCGSEEVRPTREEPDIADAAAEAAESLEDTGDHEAYFVGEFGAWLESMQADGYATDDVARAVQAECDALLVDR